MSPDLQALTLAWRDGDPSAGGPLLDALEEAGLASCRQALSDALRFGSYHNECAAVRRLVLEAGASWAWFPYARPSNMAAWLHARLDARFGPLKINVRRHRRGDRCYLLVRPATPEGRFPVAKIRLALGHRGCRRPRTLGPHLCLDQSSWKPVFLESRGGGP